MSIYTFLHSVCWVGLVPTHLCYKWPRSVENIGPEIITSARCDLYPLLSAFFFVLSSVSCKFMYCIFTAYYSIAFLRPANSCHAISMARHFTSIIFSQPLPANTDCMYVMFGYCHRNSACLSSVCNAIVEVPRCVYLSSLPPWQRGDDLNQFIKITDLNQFKSAIKITIKIKYSLTAILCNCSLVFTCQNASINKQTIVSSYITYIMT